jgi:hypothetical protein
MRHLLGLEVPNILPKAMGLRAAGRLIWTTLLFAVMLAPIMAAIRRPKSKQKTTWAQAMGGAVLVWALMILAYGSIPHEWLTFANGHLKWDESHFLVRSGQSIGPFTWLNLDVDKRAITDAVASVIYLVMLGLNIYIFAVWQKRPEAKDEAATTAPEEKVVGTSAYGRPVTVQA